MTPIVAFSLQVLIVSGPFLIAMITLYVTLLISEDKSTTTPISNEMQPDDDLPRHKCIANVASVSRQMYEDLEVPYYVFTCSATIVSIKHMVLPEGCIQPDSNGKYGNYILRSGSDYWSRGGQIHEVADFRNVSSNKKDSVINLIEVKPEFPPCAYNESFIDLKGSDNIHQGYVVIGWNNTQNRGYARVVNIFLEDKKGSQCINLPGGAITRNNTNRIIGFEGTDCTENDEKTFRTTEHMFFPDYSTELEEILPKKT